MESSRLDCLKYLAPLSAEEIGYLDNILNTLDSEDEDQIADMLEKLGDYPVRLLYHFSEASPELHSLMEENEYLNECWAARLKKMKYPSHHITSFDGETGISLFSLIKCVPIMKVVNEYLETEKNLGDPHIFPLLNQACDLGSYKALVLRLGHYTQLINESSHEHRNSDTITTYIAFQFHDANKLSNLYWAMGCIDGALILFNSAQYYFGLKAFEANVKSYVANSSTSHFSWAKKYDDNNRPYPILLVQMAVENIYIARLLAEFPQSKQITEELSHGRGVLDGFENVFTNNEGLQKYVMERLAAIHIELVESFCRNAYLHSVKKIHEHYPDFELPEEMPESWLKVKT